MATVPQTLPQTLPQVIRQAAARFPQRSAIVDGSQTISYADLAQRSEDVARALLAQGVQAGIAWPCGRRTRPSGSSRRVARTWPVRCWCRSTRA